MSGKEWIDGRGLDKNPARAEVYNGGASRGEHDCVVILRNDVGELLFRYVYRTADFQGEELANALLEAVGAYWDKWD